MTTTYDLAPKEAVVLKDTQGGTGLIITNCEAVAGSYTYAFDRQPVLAASIAPGESAMYDVTNHGSATVTNTGTISLKVQFND